MEGRGDLCAKGVKGTPRGGNTGCFSPKGVYTFYRGEVVATLGKWCGPLCGQTPGGPVNQGVPPKGGKACWSPQVENPGSPRNRGVPRNVWWRPSSGSPILPWGPLEKLKEELDPLVTGRRDPGLETVIKLGVTKVWSPHKGATRMGLS